MQRYQNQLHRSDSGIPNEIRISYFSSFEDYLNSDQSRIDGVVVDFDLALTLSSTMKARLKDELEAHKPVLFVGLSELSADEGLADASMNQWIQFLKRARGDTSPNLRAYARVAKKIRVEIRPSLASPHTIPLETADLSPKGCFVVWNRPSHRRGDLVEIMIDEQGLRLKGRVAWVRDTPTDQAPAGIGLELYFRDFDEQKTYSALASPQ